MEHINMQRLRQAVLPLVALLLLVTVASAQSGGGTSTSLSTGYDLSWSSVDNGGGECSGGGYTLNGAVGQLDAGILSGGDYTLQGGFHRCAVLHDLDDNGVVNMSDVMQVASRWRCRCGDECYDAYYDLDDDCDIDVVDIMLVVAQWGEGSC